jgi:hypothetical protein
MTTIDAERCVEAVLTPDEPLYVETLAVDGGGLASLTVESVSRAVTVDGWTTFSAMLIGPADSAISTPGQHRAYQDGRAFTINLTRLGRRGSLVAYSAFVLEPQRELV